MALNKRLATFGLAKQTAKGAAASDPTFAVGVTGGKLLDAAIEEEDVGLTAADRVTSARERTGIAPEASAETIAMPRSLGLFLLAATGSVVTTGTEDPYTHTFKVADDVPYLTTFVSIDGNHYKVPDCKLDELGIKWERSGRVTLSSKFFGLDVVRLAAAPTPNVSDAPSAGYLRGLGGTFSVDNATARISSGTVTVTNGIQPVPGSVSVLPEDVWPGAHSLAVDLTVVPDSLALFHSTLFTGVSPDEVVRASVYEGPVSFTWKASATHDLVFTASRVALISDLPEADPEGGPAEVHVSGVLLKPITGDPYTFVLRNASASY